MRAKIDVHFDWGVFGFAAAVTLLTGLLFGLAPAWSAARSEVSSSLKESAQTTTRRRKGAGRQDRLSAFRLRSRRCWWLARDCFCARFWR